MLAPLAADLTNAIAAPSGAAVAARWGRQSSRFLSSSCLSSSPSSGFFFDLCFCSRLRSSSFSCSSESALRASAVASAREPT